VKVSPKKMSDEELVKSFIETQKNMYFEVLYDRYSDKVFRKCLSFTKDEARAEDFAHDIFLKLILNLSSYKETAKFSTWLYSITYNYCIDQTRIGKKVQEEELDEEFDEVLDDSVDTEVAEMESLRLNKAMEKLGPDDRSILMMKYQDDLSIKDIADTLDVSESAVKMRLLRAKDKLKKLYLEQIILWAVVIAKVIDWFKD
jgi:RNA polymerase sigma factor (sigma-70 family)